MLCYVEPELKLKKMLIFANLIHTQYLSRLHIGANNRGTKQAHRCTQSGLGKITAKTLTNAVRNSIVKEAAWQVLFF